MRHNRISFVGKTACAVVLSCILASSTLLDGVAETYAYAVDGSVDTSDRKSQSDSTLADGQTTEAENQKPSAEEVSKIPQLNEDNPLVSNDDSESDRKNSQLNVTEQLAPKASSSEPSPEEQSQEPVLDTSAPQTTDRVTTVAPLTKGEGAPSTAGYVLVDGLNYAVNSDGFTAKVVGWSGAVAPSGDVTIAQKVVSGNDTYTVNAIADEAFKDCGEMESLVLPDSLEAVGKDAFKGCSKLERFSMGDNSPAYSVFDDMLFDKERATLVRCPEGKQAVALLPESMTAFADDAFSGCRNLSAIQVNEGSQAYVSVDGVLYTADRARLVMAPAHTMTVIVQPETNTIAEKAFSLCGSLASIVANGHVKTIEGGAFTVDALANAVVALPGGDDYDQRKAVWVEAGFQHFSEPATPGEITTPEPDQSGFTFQLLDDFTVSVSWSGEDKPEGDLEMPATANINGVEYRVSAIAPQGFVDCAALTSVQIRAPIAVIGDDAFAGCSNLASVSMAEGVTSIGAGAFAGTAVERIDVPASVTSIGAGAFANCSNLSKILTFSNDIDVAGDALAGVQGVQIYAPYSEAGYPWTLGLVASGNSIQPYGVSLPSDPLAVEVGETADLFEGGLCEVPEGCELTYAYGATPISVEAGQVTGKKAGISEITVVLSLDGVELSRAVRSVEVTQASRAAMSLDVGSSPRFGVSSDAWWDLQDGSSPKSTSCTTGQLVDRPANPTRDGYVFAGWYNEKGCLTKWNFETDTMQWANKTFYAKWREGKVFGIRC